MDWETYKRQFTEYAVSRGVSRFDVFCNEQLIWEDYQDGVNIIESFEKLF